ncbi:MAG: FtsX-like permease family protein [Bacteroidetes bacterium]|nr:FtsX-like permease family protein [Bacteroidota bacterium]
MNFPLYIARRYLFSRKSHNIINIISLISAAGVMIVTAALVIVLSVFNGFARLSESLFNSFNPDMAITLKQGKTFRTDELDIRRLKKIKGVKYVTEVVEENALMKYLDKQSIVTLKGVSSGYEKMCGIDTMMAAGHFILEQGDMNYAVLGYGIADYLGANLSDFKNPITVYVARRDADFSNVFDNAFNTASIFPSGTFSIQTDFDVKYVLLPIRFLRQILGYHEELTSLEIGLDKFADPGKVQKEIQEAAGGKFMVKNRYEQQELIYKIFRTEKWAIVMILAFILLIATFNVIASISMLILEKKKDIAVLQSLGASKTLVQRIFMIEGMLISFCGAVTGLVLGAVICWAQMRFGLIRLGDINSTFVVNSYPVHMIPIDFLIIFVIVMVIGFIVGWYQIYNIRKIDATMMRAE